MGNNCSNLCCLAKEMRYSLKYSRKLLHTFHKKLVAQPDYRLLTCPSPNLLCRAQGQQLISIPDLIFWHCMILAKQQHLYWVLPSFSHGWMNGTVLWDTYIIVFWWCAYLTWILIYSNGNRHFASTCQFEWHKVYERPFKSMFYCY